VNATADLKLARTLSALHEVKLLPSFQAIYNRVAPGASGPAPWRQWKLGAAHQLLALTQESGRLTIQFLDLSEALRAVLLMRVPVPCRRGGEGPLFIEPVAQLALTYRMEAMMAAQPGYSFIEILAPRDVYHSNVSPSYAPPGAQVLCLGPSLKGVKIVDLVLMAYGAISLQTVQFSLTDPAGLLNPAAALWLQSNCRAIPLTREPFLTHTPKPA